LDGKVRGKPWQAETLQAAEQQEHDDDH